MATLKELLQLTWQSLGTARMNLPKEDVRFWIKLFQLLQEEAKAYPSVDSLCIKLNRNTQTIMRYYWKSCMTSTMESLENLFNKTGVMLESYSSMSIPSENLQTVQDLLLHLILLEMHSSIDDYSDILLTPKKSTSGMTAHTATDVADVRSGTSFPSLKRKLAQLEDSSQTLEKSGYLSAFISYSENEETKKYGLEEHLKDHLINVSINMIHW